MSLLRHSRATRRTPVRAGLVLALALLALGFAGCADAERPGLPSQDVGGTDPGSVAYAQMHQFSQRLGPRVTGGEAAIRARAYLVAVLQQYGYEPQYQEFLRGGEHSANIIAVKPGQSPTTLVIGAHYDTARGSPGAMDNASGIGLLIELAARLRQQATPYSLVFVAFGAEETGLYGSQHYLEELDGTERRATLGMINLDGVAGGKRLYLYGVAGEDAWLRRDIEVVADEQQLALAADPTLDVHPPVGYRQGYELAGDHIPFAGYGIPCAGFISGDLDAGDLKQSFWPMNTPADTVDRLEEGGDAATARGQLRDLAELLEVVLTSKLEDGT